MLIAWLKAVHVIGVVTWAGGLFALTRLLWCHGRGDSPPLGSERLLSTERSLYRTVCAPGLFLTLFTGIFLLHQQPALLEQPWMHVKLTAVLLLFVVDHLCMRGPRLLSEGRASGRRFAILHGLTLVLMALPAISVLVRPWAR